MPWRFDRERSIAFGRFVWKRFVDDKCFETAGALSYTTMFALVPLTVAVFTILTALPVFKGWTSILTDFLFRNFVPAAGDAVQKYVLEFAGNASKLTSIGIVVILLSALMMMYSIEDRFNRIWRVQTKRSAIPRFMMYWAALTLGPVLIVAGLTLTSYLAALPLLGGAGPDEAFKRDMLGVLPFVVSVLGLFAMYVLIPNRKVAARYAAIGAVLAAVLFEIAKLAFTGYVSSVPSYREIYGALAVVPIFLIWIYLSWVIVLLGASITASISAFDYRPRADHLPDGAEFLGLMHLLKHFVAAQRHGHALGEDGLQVCERFVSDDLLQRYLADLSDAGLIQRTEDDEWVMVHSLETATLMEIYEAGRYRLPLDEQLLERFCRGLPSPLRAQLGNMARALRGSLDTHLSQLFFVPDPKTSGSGSTPQNSPESA